MQLRTRIIVGTCALFPHCMKRLTLSAICLSLSLALTLQAGTPARITVETDRPGHKIPPTLWGIFFEDINLSADGGIYPEMVRNRSFEDGEQPTNWTLVKAPDSKTEMAIDSSKALNPFNRRSLRVRLDGTASLINEGYWGMNLVKGESYTLKLAARATNGFRGPLTVRLLGKADEKLAAGEITGLSGDWKYYSFTLTAAGSDAHARLELSASGEGTLFLDMVSLMPNKTWKGHGLRPDLAEALDGLKPSFVRFPGGCWVEGDDMARMYHWKKTIGDIALREPLWNIWGYNATHGLGFHEYLQLTEDLGATPLFCINVGMSHKEVIPMDQMGQWVQDALDAIEYANGPTSSVWGGLRARSGHPAPFNLKYLEIGNENGGEAYQERWQLFVQAIKAKYPEVQLVANHWHGGYPKEPAPDIVDEHYYNTPEFFMQQAKHYDTYDRNGPKIFVGEYAVTKNCGLGNLRAAIGEAAFMTGLERNSDVVIMASYAPLFVNMNHRHWNPDLVNFDSARWYGLPSYYVQKLFSEHRGDVMLPVSVKAEAVPEKPITGAIGVGTWNTEAEFKDVKVTAPDGRVLFASDFSNNADGWKQLGGGQWKVEDGALKQTAEKEFVRAIAGDRSWTDYTLKLKARKLGGREGFLVLFHINGDDDRLWWNIGGWRNSKHGIEMGGTIAEKKGSIETGKWYDIKVVTRGRSIKCYLDGKLVHDVNQGAVNPLYASATRDEKSGDVIVKVVNTSAGAVEAIIDLKGAQQVASTAQVIVLASANPADENSLAEPTKVAPKSMSQQISGSNFIRTFPGNSLTVLRIGSRN
jgi:alpha-L-arabinofuranosidase